MELYAIISLKGGEEMTLRYYSIQEIADILKFNTLTINRYINEGKLKAYKIGKDWRISENDFKKFMEDRSNIKSKGD